MQNAEFHQLFVDLGLEVYKIEDKDEASEALAASIADPEVVTPPTPATPAAPAAAAPKKAETAAPSLPEHHPELQNIEVQMDPSMPVWMVKKKLEVYQKAPPS